MKRQKSSNQKTGIGNMDIWRFWMIPPVPQILQTSLLVGTLFAVSYSKTALVLATLRYLAYLHFIAYWTDIGHVRHVLLGLDLHENTRSDYFEFLCCLGYITLKSSLFFSISEWAGEMHFQCLVGVRTTMGWNKFLKTCFVFLFLFFLISFFTFI